MDAAGEFPASAPGVLRGIGRAAAAGAGGWARSGAAAAVIDATLGVAADVADAAMVPATAGTAIKAAIAAPTMIADRARFPIASKHRPWR